VSAFAFVVIAVIVAALASAANVVAFVLANLMRRAALRAFLSRPHRHRGGTDPHA